MLLYAHAIIVTSAYFCLCQKDLQINSLLTCKFTINVDVEMAFNDFTVEFSVNLTCNNCVERTTEVLSRTEGISDFTVDLDQQSVVVTSSLPASLLKTLIESTGKRAVVVGLGSSKRPNLGSAVAALGGAMGHCTSESAVGVIRFVQMDENTCLVDGVVDGLRPYGNHALAVHECGDLSGGCYSLGPHFNPRGVRHGSPQNDVNSRHAGDLGNVTADSNGRASFRYSLP